MSVNVCNWRKSGQLATNSKRCGVQFGNPKPVRM